MYPFNFIAEKKDAKVGYCISICYYCLENSSYACNRLTIALVAAYEPYSQSTEKFLTYSHYFGVTMVTIGDTYRKLMH